MFTYTKENNAFEKEKKMITLTTMWGPVWRPATDQVNGNDEPLHSQTSPQKDGKRMQIHVCAC